MSMKEILNRIKKLEEQKNAPDMVTLVLLVDGKEERHAVKMHEATERIMEQSSKIFFGGECDENNRIIGVEYEESDGFLESLLDTEPVENIEEIVET